MTLSFPIRGPSVQRMVKELGIPLGSAQLIKQSMEHGKAKTALYYANEVMGGHGVESLWPEYPYVSYVNLGDTYVKTLFYTGKSFQIGSWGDWVEGHRGVACDGSNPRDSKYWRADPRWAKKGRTRAKTDKQWTPQQLQAHRALMRASEKMGWNNYQAGLAAHVRAGRKKHTYRYCPTEEHERVIKASSDVLKGKITPEQAMAMLHEYDIFNQRMGQGKRGPVRHPLQDSLASKYRPRGAKEKRGR